MTLQQEFNQLVSESNDLIAFLQVCSQLSIDVRTWCIMALRVHIHSGTPLAGIKEFAETVKQVKSLISRELEG